MRLGLLDWSMVAGLVLVLVVAALWARRYSRSVAGFLSAERAAGRYLVTVAYNMAQVGVITLVWFFQVGYDVGYTQIWWGFLEGPSLIVLAVTGWVIYRFRETRAMTLAQFFELRYSRRFRIFSGLTAFLAGILNYGIFPGVTARFFMAACGLPEMVAVPGTSVAVPLFPLLMLLLLGFAIFLIFAGGMVSIIVTDFIQGVFCFGTFVFLCFYLLGRFPWPRLEAAMLQMPPGTSMVNPLGLANEANFDPWYWAIGAFILFYAARAWQGDQGYNSAPLNPHEARMAQLLNGWRYRVLMLVTIVVPLAVRAFLTLPEYADQAAPIHEVLAAQPTDALRAELRTPLAMAVMLPAGILGLFVAAMLGAAVSTDEAYLHSWAAIFVQDVVLPFRKRPFTPVTHVRLLKLAALGVAVFAFFFSLVVQPTQYVAMFASLTASIFVGGAGAVIIGGLYWRRGTTAAAWAAMITGMVLSGVGMCAKQFAGAAGSDWPAWLARLRPALAWIDGHLTGQELSFFAMMGASLVYVGVSLASKAPAFDLERMLHRGRYRVEGDASLDERPQTLLEKLGFDRAFRGWDRFVAWITLAWPLFFTVLFVVATPWLFWRKAAGDGVADATWASAWHGWTWMVLLVSAVVVVWFSIGGIRDLVRMVRILRARAVNVRDDGTVVDGVNADERS